MSKPTMLLPGKIKITPHMSDYDINKIKTLQAKDYVLEWFAQRVPSRRGGIPLISAETPTDRILILRSGTGSGKSTTLAPELYLRFNESVKKNIVITQPRILTAMSIPKNIARIYDEFTLGDNIGYQTGVYTYAPKKGIIFMTTGVLAQQLTTMPDDELMQRYSFIIIDECHNRSVEMDLVLSLSKQLIHRNFKKSNCPFLILTSATFDVVKYSNFFKTDSKQIIDIEGLNYPIKKIWAKTNIANYVNAAVEKAIHIHKTNTDDYKNQFTDILIFIYGAAPLTAIINKLTKINSSLSDNFIPISLTGSTFKKGNIDYQNIFKPLASIKLDFKDGKTATPKRRIIVATNVAETGVTIDTLKYVIDTGFENFAMFNPVYRVSSLIPIPITQASALQRLGRTGRLAPGEWYPLYTESSFKLMQTDKFPDIISTDISDFILSLIVKTVHPNWDGVISTTVDVGGVFDISKIMLLDNPSVDSIQHSLEKLYVLGMIDNTYKPTIFGLTAVSIIHVDIESIRMIMAGYQYGANILDLITIAAFMSFNKDTYIKRWSKTKYNYKTTFLKNEEQLLFYDRIFMADDFIQCIFIWIDFINQIKLMKKKLSINYIEQWCKDNGLVYEGMLQIIERRDSIIESFIQTIGLNPFYNELKLKNYDLQQIFQTDFSMGIGEIGKLKNCIYEGFRLNTATWNADRLSYFMDSTHSKIKVYSDAVKALPSHESLEQGKPKKILVRRVRMEKSKFNELYQFEVHRVSVLDKYVYTDETFSCS
jgi:HrpA-like RNA helicase